jgi:D-sedoheptulose 7-phosphate isomerase
MTDWIEYCESHLEESAKVKLAAKECIPLLIQSAEMSADMFRSGGKLLLCGNGGSAADSQHLAAEFLSSLSTAYERPGMAAIALTTDTSMITSRGNDYGFDSIFSRQVEAIGRQGDILIAFSTSGNSKNVLLAVEAARTQGLNVIGFLGGTGGKIAAMCDVALVVPSHSTQHIQETHIAFYHLYCGMVERLVYPK